MPPSQQYDFSAELVQSISQRTLEVEEKVTGGTVPVYPDFVRALLKPMPREIDNLLHCVLGISGESGELVDAVKKHWAYNKPLDHENILEEMGDLFFYFQGMMNLFGIELDTLVRLNQHKLLQRFPNVAYTDFHAQARLDKQ